MKVAKECFQYQQKKIKDKLKLDKELKRFYLDFKYTK